ncbi:MAG: hypothetical protein M1834_009185 [Cirrosporium novae-zelandiae]|nr:MAG: hypothetical protein M1834_009185 [Cirrosporium novae-zelandiae]
MNTSSPLLPFPSSFDPAICLHSDSDINQPSTRITPPSSDDLEALHIVQAETTKDRNRKGIVIQHRAWKIEEVFRSDEDHLQETPLKKHSVFTSIEFNHPLHQTFPSSPPSMAPLSSPIAYPRSSSPACAPKRRDGPKHAAPEPKRQKMLGGFIIDDDDDDDEPIEHNKEPKQQKTLGGFIIDDDDEVMADDRETSLDGPLVSQQQSSFLQPSSSPSISRHLSPFAQNDRTQFAPPRSLAPDFSQSTPHHYGTGKITLKTSSGKTYVCQKCKDSAPISYERLVADRSKTKEGRAQKSYYGIDVHRLIDDAAKDIERSRREALARDQDAFLTGVENLMAVDQRGAPRTLMWTEKYRARKFTDLVGDDRMHRSVLRWLKGWDPIVFPGLEQRKPKKRVFDDNSEDRPFRKILLLAGPPGLGKTTLAHVCARQAGYEVVEINASDERNRDVVKGRIRDSVGTENVRGVNIETVNGKVRKAGRPVCVVVDEVDGVVGGSNGGEGGFMKTLIDLVMLDQKNSKDKEKNSSSKRKKKGDNFRLLRPLVMICNDVYHPALRPLRSSGVAEIIHVRKPPLDRVATRLKIIFEKECVPCDNDAARRICELSWGISSGREDRGKGGGSGEGDIRSVLVTGEWVAAKLRSLKVPRLTKGWVEQQMSNNLSSGESGARGLGRGSIREIVDRVFLEGGGFPKAFHVPSEMPILIDPTVKLHASEPAKRATMYRLREMVDTSGDYDRIVTDCFGSYPNQTFQDDTLLSKPNSAYDWLDFHDRISAKVYSQQEWELNPYLSQSVLAFHHLFASLGQSTLGAETLAYGKDETEEPSPFSGPRADFAAREAEKESRSVLQGFQSCLSAPLLRTFRSLDDISTDLVPQLYRMLSPNVKPIVVGGSGDQRGIASVRRETEKDMVQRAVRVMCSVGVVFERTRIEDERGGYGGFIFRMEPPLDTLVTFQTASSSSTSHAPVRYAIRQVLDQEYQKEIVRVRAQAREARLGYPVSQPDSLDLTMDKENASLLNPKTTKTPTVRRDFFGRIINEVRRPALTEKEELRKKKARSTRNEENQVWISFHEGFSNAVRKPITLEDLLREL